AAAGAAEGLEDLLDDLVGAVGRPHLLGGQAVAQVGGQLGAELDGVPVGVAVELAGDPADSLRQVGDQGGGRRVRVLVGVEPDRDVDLRRAVGALAAQVVADGQVGEVHDGTCQSNRARIAAPWAGKSSASASTDTCAAASASASRV